MLWSGAVIALFWFFFCRGPSGLFAILSDGHKQRKLQAELYDLQLKALMLKSDIEEHRKPENIKRTAQNWLGMKSAEDSARARSDTGQTTGTR